MTFFDNLLKDLPGTVSQSGSGSVSIRPLILQGITDITVSIPMPMIGSSYQLCFSGDDGTLSSADLTTTGPACKG